MNNMVQLLYTFLFHFAADPSESDDVSAKKVILAGSHFLVIPYLLAFAFLYYYLKETITALIAVCYIVWSLAVVFVIPKFQKNLEGRANVLGTGVLIVMLAFTISLGGFENSSYVLPFFGLANPLIALINFKPRDAAFWLAIHIVSILVVFFLQPYLPAHNLPPLVLSIVFISNSIVMSVLYFSIFVYFINQRDEAFRLLHVEREKSEKLLLNILPQDIALILKNEDRVIADHFPNVSILFADVVNFTPMSAQMTPIELVELLNEVYSYFDMLVEKYGLEKIKTIGDCYMVAAGVPRRRLDHALVLTQLALDIRDYVSQHEFHGHFLKFRIGLNSGSVVAGVIGQKKFAYDLWGDAVNTASRMESHSAGGSIQVTEATYDLIKEEFVCDPRGTIQLKGKGEMPVWFVIEKR